METANFQASASLAFPSPEMENASPLGLNPLQSRVLLLL